MLDEDDYADDPIQTAATTAERVEDTAVEARDALDGAPSTGEIEDALDDLEMSVDEIRKQQEAAQQALKKLNGRVHTRAGVIGLAQGCDDAYDLIEEIRGMSRSMVEGLVAAGAGEEPAAETEVEIAGTRYRIRFDPMEEAETGEPIHHRDPNEGDDSE